MATSKRICLLGMHRSGTSLLANLLQHAGIYLGAEEDMLLPQTDNPDGFFERKDVVALNDDLLASFGSTWDCPVSTDLLDGKQTPPDFLASVDSGLSTRIKQIVKQLEAQPCWLVKDPRLCLTFPVWDKIVSFDRIIVLLRNPGDIAKSLQRRNAMPARIALALWEYYTTTMCAHLDGRETIFLHYEDLLSKPEITLNNLLDCLGTGVGDSIRRPVLAELSKRIRPPRRKQQSGPAVRLSSTQKDLYAQLCNGQLAQLRPGLESLQLLHAYSGISAGADSRLALSQRLAEKEDELLRLLQAHNTLNKEHSELADAFGLDNRELGQLRAHHQRMQADYEKLAIAHRKDNKELKDLRLRYQRMQDEGGKLAAAHRSDNEELAQLREHYKNRQEEFEKLAAAHHADNEELMGLRKNYQQNILELERLSRSYERLQALHDTVSAVHEEDLSEIHSVYDRLKDAETQLAQTRAQYARDVNEVAKERDRLREEVALAQNNITELTDTLGWSRSELYDIAQTLWEFRISFFGRIVAQLSRLYKLLTLRLGAPNGLEAVLIKTVPYRQVSSPSVKDAPSGSSISFKAILALKIIARAAASPIKTFKSLDRQRLANFKKVLFDLPEHQAKLVAESALKRHLEGHTAKVKLLAFSGNISFPRASKRPEVSILVPVYNELSTTLDCLQAIEAHTDFSKVSYEVVLADDCSSDDTRNIKRQVSGMQIVRQRSNQGFLRNCNRAAKKCRGEYILLLNNDTQVQPGWLEELLAALKADPTAGLVGPKLLFGDGTLQEAGGIIWRDASGWNWGRNEDPARPEYNYVRDADYISGACMLFKKSLWDTLGGFDELYLPAYYEDTDLAFRIREMGKRILYVPTAEVVHLEGVSHGTDESSGIKKHQLENQKKFRDRWAKVLDRDHFENGTEVFLARENGPRRNTILVVDHYVPHYDRDAGSRCCYNYVRLFLKAGLKVIFIGDNFYPHQPYTADLQALGVEVLYGNWYAKNWADWLQSNAGNIDYCYLQRPHIVGPYLDVLEQVPNKPRLIYFGHDLHFLRVQRQAELERDKGLLQEAHSWKEKEFEIFHRVDTVLYPSQHEVDVIKRIEPELQVKAIPLYVYNQWASDVPDLAGRNSLLFIGGYAHPPNLDAVVWFIENVFASVRARFSTIELLVVGSNPPEELSQLADRQIRIVGQVSDSELEQLYAQARVALVPLRYGAGVKGKVLEAMSKGVPVLSTSIGAEGIRTVQGALTVADDATDFAEQLLELLSDDNRWCQQSALGLETIAKNYSEAHVLQDVFAELGIEQAGPR